MGKEDEMLFFKYGEGSSILFFSGRGLFPVNYTLTFLFLSEAS
jgi:hypothetical protein